MTKAELLKKELRAQPSNYDPLQGDEFFLLSETSYGSQDMASMRVEMQPNGNALQDNGGLDIAIYRVPDPLAFLRSQSNLHRVKLPSKVQPEGMSNMLRVAWDKVWANARYAWRSLFSAAARVATTEAAPELKTPQDIGAASQLSRPPRYAKLQGLEAVDRFRYPLQDAKPIEAPKGVALEGSSSDFLPRSEGNVRVPIGRRAPGLYLVEATLGKFRALGLVFVSDSIAITKNSAGEMLAWVAQRSSGVAVADAKVVWSDGLGVIKSGQTNGEGIARLEARSPETSYVYGVDSKGGVFISENFYHDSEIYNAKLFAITDRPLYRPGDTVQVKFMGRKFQTARNSSPVEAGPLQLTVVDPAGTELLSQKLSFASDVGAQTSFRLPPQAEAGGWDLVFSKGEDRYGAAFRVANYVKPHFEANIVMDQVDYKTRQLVSGSVQLSYPDGSPVRNALVRLSARAQALSMVEGELQYGGQFPVAIKATEITTDSGGKAKFTLPEAAEPSRYILSVLAQDGAAYRVRANKEILIERSAYVWRLNAPAQFSEPGQRVDFSFAAQGNTAVAPGIRPVRWEAQRLEDRTNTQGAISSDAQSVSIAFAQAGSYTVRLRDAQGNLVAATSHWVAGAGLQAAPGSVEIVLDKESYQVGDVAHALVTFAQPVEQALLSLERDKVEAVALLGAKSATANWLKAHKVAPAQWRLDIPVREDFAPNITFSVLYVQGGDYVFQNKGLRVRVPAIEVLVKPERERYAPGEMVKLDIETRQAGKAVPAQLTVGVVDEMIYVLQPEIAPTMEQFFHHSRRNNVRTVASQSFIGYDLARLPAKGQAPINRTPSERGIKVLERPRRDDTDTAAWWPSLQTDGSGKISISFRMPDALSRWRVTARAMDAQGQVGQSTRYVESHKPFYAQWSGPSTWRNGDKAHATVLAFNQSGAATKLQFTAQGAGLKVQKDVELLPGMNSIGLKLEQPVSGEMTISLSQGGRLVDSMRKSIQVVSQGWASDRSLVLDLSEAAETKSLTLPADASNIRLSFAQGAQEQFQRIADDLLEYPWGCVEQTSSRLLPLSLLYSSLPSDAPGLRDMSHSLSTHRMRLVQMAGPNAIFGWWGEGTADSAWLTSYAYYADWHAARALGIKLPERHWEQVQVAYAKSATSEPLALRALAVWFMQDMGLSTRTLTEGLVQEAEKLSGNLAATSSIASQRSTWLGSSTESHAATLVLIGQLARKQQVALSEALSQRLETARTALQANPGLSGLALLAMEGRVSKAVARSALSDAGVQSPTLDRALSLVWWSKALGGVGGSASNKMAEPVNNAGTGGEWKRLTNTLTRTWGAATWRWTGEAPPPSLQFAKIGSDTSAIVRYRSAQSEITGKGEGNAAFTSTLPMRIERKLYRLVAQAKSPVKKESSDRDAESLSLADANATLAGDAVEFARELTKDADIKANELYMEEVRLIPQGEMPRYGLLEVPLPPGAEVERGTWGITIRDLNGDGQVIAIDRARSQAGALSYAVPLDGGKATTEPIRHLLRFGSKGSFALPPARFYRMYQPQEQAFEAGTRRMQVR